MPALDLIAWTLLGVWALLLFGGLFYRSKGADGRRIPQRARLGSSLVLVLLAWYGYALAVPDPASDFAFLIAIGMSAGFAGDLFMAGLLPIGNRILGGITAFGLGHIAYILAVVRQGPVSLAPVIGWLLVGTILSYFVLLREQRPGFLPWAALGYALLLSATSGVASSLALVHSLFTTMAVGATLFLVSDLILAAEIFTPHRFPGHGDWVWLTYGPGQALIVISTWGAMQTL